MSSENNYIWKDRKRWIFGLPFSFTRYRLEKDKFIIDTGFWSRNEDEIRLYRILDLTLKRSFGERLFGLGTIHCCSGDKTSPEFEIKHIKNPKKFKDMLSDMIEKCRIERRVGLREHMSDYDDDHDIGDISCDCGID